MKPQIPLALYTRLCTALSVGIPLGHLLSSCGLREEQWSQERDAWADVISKKLGEDSEFDSEYSKELFEARYLIRRSVEPLESDRDAWLAFVAHWAMSAAPSEFIKNAGILSHDFSRLQQKWGEYFFDHPEEQKLDLPRPGPPGPPPLVVGKWEVDTALSEYQALAHDLIMSSQQEAAPVEEPGEKPPLFATLPGSA